MTRWILLALFFTVLISPLLLSSKPARQVVMRQADVELVVITPHQEAIRREFADAFSRWYKQQTGKTVRIDYRTFGTGDISRYFQELSKTSFKSMGTYGIDVAWGGGDAFFDNELKKPGYLQPLRLTQAELAAIYPQPRLGGLPLYDLDAKDGPVWFGTALSSFGIVYNREVLRNLGVPEPKTWADLADPRLQGWVAMADPTRGYSAKQAYMAILERAMADAAQRGESMDIGWARGMGTIRLISANARLFTDSSSVVPIMVSQGEAAGGMAIDFYGRSQADAVGLERMGYVEPENATVINPDPVGIVKGAPHLELSGQFVRFLLSPEGQLLWCTRPGNPGGPATTALWRQPVRQDVYRDMSSFTMPLNPFTLASTFNKSPERQGSWGIFADLVQMSCIDLMDELVATRKAILASPRAQELDARLALFPFDQKEALARMKAYKVAPAQERLRLQRQWTQEFRQEYARLRAEAGQ